MSSQTALGDLPAGVVRHLCAACVALVVLQGPQAARAETPSDAAAIASASGSESRWGLGLGGGTIRRPYRGVDDETVALPILLFENRWLSMAGPGIDLKFPSTAPLSFRLRARYELGLGYEAVDAPALAGMAERKAGLWMGAAALWRTGVVDIEAEWLGDVSGYSEGQRATLGLQRRVPLGGFSITPRVEAIWLDRRNVDYYYGVRSQEVRAGRSLYEPDSTVNLRLGLRVDYRILPDHVLSLDLSATRLGSAIEDSPIVDRSGTSAAFVAYSYRF
ncbi:hypothetical protein C1M51_13490 [Methylibium sp. Pch-M]|uniref:MipA/OmpV family protein n=1 Tax=Methylibium sp. Pch-M TaxID=2082386 RepID=UPI001011166E|nr:MipA/OmpV family protein [Methylibium sp. Pch-M]QAZ40356.1 hypothetical protein C1M51_13490 [Methylibium sp. Pch-M]